jgi:hypothetical protein
MYPTLAYFERMLADEQRRSEWAMLEDARKARSDRVGWWARLVTRLAALASKRVSR